MAIAGAGFGASKGLEEIIGEQMLRAQMAAREREAAERTALEQQRLAESQRQFNVRTDADDRVRRDRNNQHGIELMQADRGEMDMESALGSLPEHLKPISGLMKVGALGKLSPDDLASPEDRARAAMAEEESQIRIRRASQAPQRPERDPIADHEAKLKLDQKYKTGQTTGPTPYAQERSARTLQSVDELMGKISGKTAGWGNLAAGIPASDAMNFASELDTLKANIAFNELTAMREASKTGGALGQVSNVELKLLESALGALNPRQSPENLRAQLSKIKESIGRWRQAADAGTPSPLTPIAPASSHGTNPSSRVDELIKKYGRGGV